MAPVETLAIIHKHVRMKWSTNSEFIWIFGAKAYSVIYSAATKRLHMRCQTMVNTFYSFFWTLLDDPPFLSSSVLPERDNTHHDLWKWHSKSPSSSDEPQSSPLKKTKQTIKNGVQLQSSLWVYVLFLYISHMEGESGEQMYSITKFSNIMNTRYWRTHEIFDRREYVRLILCWFSKKGLGLHMLISIWRWEQ